MSQEPKFPPQGSKPVEVPNRILTKKGDKWYLDDEPYYEKRSDGIVVWSQDGYRRWDFPDGKFIWTYKNLRHRIGKPAVVSNSEGHEQWFQNDLLHRTDEPAEITKTSKKWWYAGVLHRLDGPAIENQDGSKEWWVDGHKMKNNPTKKEIKKFHKKHKIIIDEIGSGEYGCVYNQPLLCENRHIIFDMDKVVTKRFKHFEDYENEIKIANTIDKIDSSGNYHFKKYGQCEKSKMYNVTPRCQSIKDQQPPLIYYEKGEKDLHSILEDVTDIGEYYKILHGLLNLFDGVVFFQKEKFVHFDIKPSNIVRTPDGKYKFIDFGLSATISPTNRKFNILSSIYEIWPPESIKLSSDIVTSSMIDKYVTGYVKNVINHHKIIDKDNLTKIIDDFKIDESNIFKAFAGIDVFSLGYTMMKVLSAGMRINAIIPPILKDLVDDMMLYNTLRIDIQIARDKYQAILKILPTIPTI